MTMRIIITASLFLSFFLLGAGLLDDLKIWAEAWKKRYIVRTGAELDDAFLDFQPGTLLSISIVGAGLASLSMFLLADSILLALLVGAGVLWAPRLWLSFIKKERARRFDNQLPDGLVSVANSLRAGLSLPQAFESVAQGYPPPLSEEIDLVLKEVSLGRELEGAINAMSRRVESREAELLSTVLAAVKGIGGNLSDVLERIAVTLRERQGLEEKIRALTAQGRFQGIIIGLMPPALGSVLYLLDPGMITGLFNDPLGWGVLAAVILFEGIGIVFIRKIAAIDI